MIYTYPDYYKEFKCIADECKDTCCAGWQIVIDEASLKLYKSVSAEHEFKERLDKSIDWKEEVFKQDECRRCAFLNEKNLCDMYVALGEESLCHTCATYPRHIEEFENLREVTLSISCPEVARILLCKVDKVTFYEEENGEEECLDEYEDFDDLMFGILQDVRQVVISIMQDRTLDVRVRSAIVWEMADELQECIDNGDAFYCQDVLEKYVGDISLNNSVSAQIIKEMKSKLDDFLGNPKQYYDTSLDMFKKLYQMEVLMEDWEQQVDETSLMLYGKDEKYYASLCREFEEWLNTNMLHWQVQFEQIVVYFLSTYLCGAVYDGWVASKTKMSVAAAFYIHEILMSVWLKNGKKLVEDDIINVTYRYSRELEHSDINLDEMEECMSQ